MVNYLYDTHCHLDLFESRNEIINEIESAEIYTIAVTNLPILFEKLNREISSKYIRPALGFHPELLQQYNKYIPLMWSLLSETRYIGEVGLDFKTGKHFHELQVGFFEELIKRCNICGNKILTVHSRMSADKVVSIIGNDFNGKIILHWFSGSKTILKSAIDNGYYFSINYSMVKSKAGQDIIRSIPLNRLLLETDAPFTQYNNNIFRPKYINFIVTEISLLLGLSVENMQTILWNNFKDIIS